MKRNRYVLGIGIVVISISTYLGLAYWREINSGTTLVEQVRLARAEGIPTNATEFAALIQTAEPSENAASHYQNFDSYRVRKGDSSAIATDLIFENTATDLSKAKSFLTASTSALRFVDEAVKLPRCWFDRDWSLGW